MKKYLKIFVLIFALCFIVNVNCVSAYATSSPDYDKISKQLADDVKKHHIPGMAVMVVDKDSVLFQETYGNCNSIDTPFIIGSMSKSFTSVAIMQLVEENKIDLNKPVSEYINATEWFVDSSDCEKITVRDLLNQTSGIEAFQTFGDLESTDSYGKYIYANANYGLLGLIIESVSGQTYEEYITKNIFEPLGMTHSAATLEKSEENGLIPGYRNYFGIPVKGKPDYPDEIKSGMWTNVPAGYLSASASDMGEYLQMYLNGGENILSEKSINNMFYDNVPADEGSYYGMGWNYSTEMFSKPVIWHAGLVENYTSNMFIIPEEGIAVVVLVNMNDYLVTNNLLANMVNPLIGEERQDLPNLYLILHLAIDVICLLLCFISIFSIVTANRGNKKGKRTSIVINVIIHIGLPLLLIFAPMLLGTPIYVFWLFVKDICVLFYANAIVLIGVGIYKLLIIKHRELKSNKIT